MPSPHQAVARCLEYLEVELADTTPADPDHPLPVPGQPAPTDVADPVPALLAQARAEPTRHVTAVFDRS